MDVEKILRKLEELQYVRLSRITGDYYTVYCPFHKDGQERKPSCGVLLREQYRNGQRYPAGFWHCFTCNTAKTMVEAVTEILKSKNISKSGLEWLKENIDGFEPDKEFESLIPEDLFLNVNDKFAVDYILKQTQKSTQQFVSEEELASYRFTVPYMYSRGLTDELIEMYDIGFDANHVPPGRKKPLPCITFPVRDVNGNTLFFCRRSIEGKYFNYPQGVTKPVYGIDQVPKNCRSLVICESCLNALTLVKFGYPAVALLGTGNSYQIKQLRELGVREFVICMDGDDAGKRATSKLKKALQDVSIVWSIEMPIGKDANDCTKEEFDELYSNKI